MSIEAPECIKNNDTPTTKIPTSNVPGTSNYELGSIVLDIDLVLSINANYHENTNPPFSSISKNLKTYWNSRVFEVCAIWGKFGIGGLTENECAFM